MQWPSVSPGMGEIFSASLLKGEDYFVQQAREWDEKMAEQLKRNIEKANAEGADVELEDFIFPDWDPMKNY
ncbi:MAG: hypothetical protein U5P10_01555 [Spirochaetia bacterium]|nr:hypothetical protein [Spirochaetia bacterium]